MVFDLLKPFGCVVRVRNGDLRAIDSAWLTRLVRRHALVVLRGFEALDRDQFLGKSDGLIEGHSERVEWDFGPVMELHVKPDVKNYLFSREAVPFHWDGAFHVEPSFLLFHCLEAPDAEAGGETLFTNTRLIFDAVGTEEQEEWKRVQLSYTTEKKAHYGGHFSTNMVCTHPGDGGPIVRFAEPVETDLNPVSLTIDGGTEALLPRMRELLYSPAHCYSHRWEAGDYVIADNHTLLHGRRPFTRETPRHIRRIQLR